MKTDGLPGSVLYSMVVNRFRYGKNPDLIENYLDSSWFTGRLYTHLGGRPARWNGTGYITDPKSEQIRAEAKKIMRDFCSLSDLEAETALVNRSVTEAAKFSIKAKNQRLYPDVENLLMEKCKGKKSRLNALLTYCGHWGLVPDNMTEITIIAGFEGGRRGDLGKEFMRKLAANKKHCRELLEQIMKMDGISENEPITKIMERLA